ncbi:MAG: hypothetical protein ACI9XZ_001064 [Alphaproteobacteria bacterium]|jgi:hypothetical protein
MGRFSDKTTSTHSLGYLQECSTIGATTCSIRRITSYMQALPSTNYPRNTDWQGAIVFYIACEVCTQRNNSIDRLVNRRFAAQCHEGRSTRKPDETNDDHA